MGLIALLDSKYNGEPTPTGDYTSQTVIITGSNTGLGLEAARHIVRLGASTVILAVRDTSKGATAQHSIEASTQRTGVVRVWELDASRFSSVRAFAARANAELKRIDALVLNAGLVATTYALSPDGWESNLQVNVLSTALLALLLLPKLRASRSDKHIPHLVTLGSETYKQFKKPPFPDAPNLLAELNTEKSFKAMGPQPRFALTKLFNIYIANSLAAQLGPANANAPDETAQPEVIVTSLCPGFCATELGRGFDGVVGKTVKALAYGTVARSAELGSRTLVDAASAGVEAHGAFWKKGRVNE